MKTVTALFAFLMLLLVESLESGSVKAQKVERLMDALGQVVELASKSSSNENLTDSASLNVAIDEIIATLDVTEWAKLAVLSWAIYSPGDADDVRFDEVFYKTCWRCISRVCTKPTTENLEALLFIEEHARFQGAERRAIDQKVKALRAGLGNEKARDKN